MHTLWQQVFRIQGSVGLWLWRKLKHIWGRKESRTTSTKSNRGLGKQHQKKAKRHITPSRTVVNQGFMNTTSKPPTLLTGSLSNLWKAGAVVRSQRWSNFRTPVINISGRWYKQKLLWPIGWRCMLAWLKPRSKKSCWKVIDRRKQMGYQSTLL